MKKYDLKPYVGFVENSVGTVSLFGYNDMAKALIRKFPKRFEYVVTIDEKFTRKEDVIRVISIEEFEQNPTENAVIVDENMQYEYLYIIYKVMNKKNMNLLNGIKTRYKYSSYTPRKHDFDYIKTRNSLPMEFTIPHDSTIRLIDAVKTSISLEGDILELGTGYGGSTYIIADTLKKHDSDKKIYTIDRFRNTAYLPDISFEKVSNNLQQFSNVVILEGEFEEQLKKLDIPKICFCFWDAYANPNVLQYVYPKIVKSGILLIDNYTHGCNMNWGKPMADLFFEDKSEKIIRIGGVQGLIIKQ